MIFENFRKNQTGFQLICSCEQYIYKDFPEDRQERRELPSLPTQPSSDLISIPCCRVQCVLGCTYIFTTKKRLFVKYGKTCLLNLHPGQLHCSSIWNNLNFRHFSHLPLFAQRPSTDFNRCYIIHSPLRTQVFPHRACCA